MLEKPSDKKAGKLWEGSSQAGPLKPGSHLGGEGGVKPRPSQSGRQRTGAGPLPAPCAGAMSPSRAEAEAGRPDVDCGRHGQRGGTPVLAGQGDGYKCVE